nr:low temperature requirement protein A [Kocuria sp. 257]
MVARCQVRRPGRPSSIDFAFGVLFAQVLWVAWLMVPASTTQVVGFVLLMLVEVSVPVVAERIGSTPWHPHHVTERYGLFTLIVLGESLAASANAIIEALHESEKLGELVAIAILALVVTAGLWWIYFWPPHHRSISSLGASLRYGYVHYFVFAAAGAFSAGIEIEIDNLSHRSHLPSLTASIRLLCRSPYSSWRSGGSLSESTRTAS